MDRAQTRRRPHTGDLWGARPKSSVPPVAHSDNVTSSAVWWLLVMGDTKTASGGTFPIRNGFGERALNAFTPV